MFQCADIGFCSKPVIINADPVFRLHAEQFTQVSGLPFFLLRRRQHQRIWSDSRLHPDLPQQFRRPVLPQPPGIKIPAVGNTVICAVGNIAASPDTALPGCSVSNMVCGNPPAIRSVFDMPDQTAQGFPGIRQPFLRGKALIGNHSVEIRPVILPASGGVISFGGLITEQVMFCRTDQCPDASGIARAIVIHAQLLRVFPRPFQRDIQFYPRNEQQIISAGKNRIQYAVRQFVIITPDADPTGEHDAGMYPDPGIVKVAVILADLFPVVKKNDGLAVFSQTRGIVAETEFRPENRIAAQQFHAVHAHTSFTRPLLRSHCQSGNPVRAADRSD